MRTTSFSDEYFMDQALRLAKKGIGWINPNPMVGALIVKNSKIIAKGYHKRVGLPHAEIEALNAVNTSVKGATLYVNLEPCSHYGRTPPCVDAIIQAGIKRVVCSVSDPNPKVHGRGIAILKQVGITVSVGLREKESRALNEQFFTFHEKERPFVAIKFAASLDGKMATYTGDSKWITNEKARKFTMETLWSTYQAVLIGINTVIKDNEPMRIPNNKFRSPLRIILDSSLRIPLGSKIFWDKNVIIATTKFANRDKYRKLTQMGIKVVSVEDDNRHVSIKALLKELYNNGVISVLVEGGGEIMGSFFDEKLVDKVYAFYAPILIGGEKAIAIKGKGVNKIKNALYLKRIAIRRFQDNFLVIGSPI